MKKASWILLTVLGVAITLLSLVSAFHAYRTGDDFGIGSARVSTIAGGDAGLATALRAIRGTSASFGAAYGVLFLAVVLGPYRRGEVWAWNALVAHPDPWHAAWRLGSPDLDRLAGRGAPSGRRPSDWVGRPSNKRLKLAATRGRSSRFDCSRKEREA